MQRYVNYTGESTITHYEIGDEYILIKSKKGVIEYRASSNSKANIEEMKILAKKGTGLSRYITKHKIKQEDTAADPKKEISSFKRLKALFSSK